jgi:hypothetical protein
LKIKIKMDVTINLTLFFLDLVLLLKKILITSKDYPELFTIIF